MKEKVIIHISREHGSLGHVVGEKLAERLKCNLYDKKLIEEIAEEHGLDIKGKTIALSGFGNVAWGAAKKATELGAKVITISGPDGYIYDPAGLDAEKIEYMLELRASGNDVCQPYEEEFDGATFFPGKKPWEQKADIYLPCATQNELKGRHLSPLCYAERTERCRC